MAICSRSSKLASRNAETVTPPPSTNTRATPRARSKLITWATALALALLEHAHAERRAFALIHFNGSVTYETTVEPGGRLPHEALFVSCGGGTSIATAFERGLEIIAGHPGALRKADIVLITDGGSDPERAPGLRERARGLQVTSLGLAIEVSQEMLGPWCDEAHAVSSLKNLDENIAAPLFTA